jgi:hypothetical protein
MILTFQLNLISQALVVNTYKNEETLPIMLKIKFKDSDLTSSNISLIRLGIEEALTEKKYSLISESTQQEALAEQAKQQKSDCYDDNCIIDTGKMLAAKFLILIDIIKLDKYVFKVQYISLETGVSEKVKSLIYNHDISNSKELLQFSKNIMNYLISKQEHYNNYNDNQDYSKESKIERAIRHNAGKLPIRYIIPHSTYGISYDFYLINDNGDKYKYINRTLLEYRTLQLNDGDMFLFYLDLNLGFNLYSDIDRNDIEFAAITIEALESVRFCIINPTEQNSSFISALGIEAKFGLLANLGTYNDLGFSTKFLLNVLWFSVGTNILYTIDNKLSIGLSSSFEIGF